MRFRFPRILAVLILLLVLAYGAASWQAGRMAQGYVYTWLAQLHDKHADGQLGVEPGTGWRPDISITEYQRGIFTSSIKYQLLLPAGPAGPGGLFTVLDELQHGPWPLAALRAGVFRPLAAYSRSRPLPGGALDEWFEATGGGAPWSASIQVGFDGRARGELDLLPAKTRNGQIDFSGTRMLVSHDAHACRFELEGRFDSLVHSSPHSGMRTRLRDVAYSAHGSCSENSSALQFGQDMTLAELEVRPPDMDVVIMRGLDLRFRSATTGSLLDGSLDYDAAQVLLNNQDMGELSLGLQAAHIDYQALQSLLAWHDWQADNDIQAPDVLARRQHELHDLLLPFLASSPQFTLSHLRLGNSHGSSRLSAQLAFQPVDDTRYVDPGMLLENSMRHFNLHISLSRPMLLQAVRQSVAASEKPEFAVSLFSMLYDSYTRQLQRQGLVRIEDGTLLADISYAHGILTVNDATAPLMDFLKMFQEVPVLQ